MIVGEIQNGNLAQLLQMLHLVQTFQIVVSQIEGVQCFDRIQIFDPPHLVVRQIEGVQDGAAFQIFDLLDQVVMEKEASEFRLVVQTTYFVDAVVLQPETSEAGVFFEVFDARETLEVQIEDVVQMRGLIEAVLLAVLA